MPQLPSGRHVAISAAPLNTLQHDAWQGHRVHEFMSIESVDDLYPYLEVMYFRPKDGKEIEQYEFGAHSNLPPEDLEPYPSGYTIATLEDEFKQWDKEDQVAFEQYLFTDEGMQDYLEDLLKQIVESRSKLKTSASPRARLLAAWWEAGVHPLQEGGD